jgi:hypothetical protein
MIVFIQIVGKVFIGGVLVEAGRVLIKNAFEEARNLGNK